MRRRVIAATAAVVAGLSTLLTVAPAQAADYDGRCDGGELCVYEHPGFQGATADFAGDIGDYAGWKFAGVPWLPLNDNASSFVSKASWYTGVVYEHGGYGGRIVDYVSPGEAVTQVGLDNAASSHRFEF